MRKLLKITDMKKKELLKRIEALEERLQPCETVAKFKRIADHAQAITNEIASPREK